MLHITALNSTAFTANASDRWFTATCKRPPTTLDNKFHELCRETGPVNTVAPSGVSRWPPVKEHWSYCVATYTGFESERLVHSDAAAKGLASDVSETMKLTSVCSHQI